MKGLPPPFGRGALGSAQLASPQASWRERSRAGRYRVAAIVGRAGTALRVLAVSALLTSAAWGAGSEPTPASAKAVETTPAAREKADAGARIFEVMCRACHTIGGGKLVGPDLRGVHERRSEDWLFRWVKDPLEMVKEDPQAQKLLAEFANVQMPKQDLSDEEIEQVLAYILVAGADGGAEAAGAKEDPLAERAEDINGRKISEFVSSECGGCHNPRRLGATGPDITRKRLLEGTDELAPMDPGSLLATIRYGRPGTSMPAWGTAKNPTMSALSAAEINAISHYLLTETAPERFHFTLQQIQESHEVLVPRTERPTEPTHGHRIDDLLLVTEREKARVAVIDGDALEVVTRLEAGTRAHGYTFHPDGRYAYNLGRDGWLYMYDLYALQPVTRVRVGLDARGVAISDDGRFLLTGMYIPAQAVMVDADTLEPLKVFDTHGLIDPEGKEVDSRICSVNDVAPDKVGPYFLMALKEAGQVWRIDYAKEGFPVTKLTEVGEILHDGFLSPDNKRFFLAAQSSNYMAVIDVETMEVEGRIATGKQPHPGPGAAWHADGKTYAATPHIGEGKNVIWDVDSLEIVGEVESGGPGLFVRTNPHMKYVWFDTLFEPKPSEIVVHEKRAPFEVVKRINDGGQTLHPEPDADGDYVFVSDWTDNVIRVYDDETLELVKTIEGLETPTGIFSVSRIEETEGH